jgi:bifunctional DNase/RNase
MSASVDEIDSRPSDAIALALKFAVPIYVNEDVMNEVAFIPDKIVTEAVKMIFSNSLSYRGL